MRTSWVFLLLGLFFVIGGVLALANPFAASLTVTTLVGIFFLAGGVLQAWFAFRDPGQPHRLWNGFVALLAIIAGVSLLANPLEGVISLTLVVAILLLASGISRVIWAFGVRGTPLFWMLLLSGLVSALLGAIILIQFPAAASSFLGLLLGFELIAEGAALFALGLMMRRLP